MPSPTYRMPVPAGSRGRSISRTTQRGPVRIALLVKAADGSWLEATATEVTIARGDSEQPARRPRAAFTIAQNEPVMLPVWLDYYSRHFDADDPYVLGHDSTDGSTEGLAGRCRVVPVHRAGSFDHRWLRTTVESFQRFLLQSYETVLFAEVDELVVADPQHYADLGAYIDALERPAARCSGFNIVEQPDAPALRFGQPCSRSAVIGTHRSSTPSACARVFRCAGPSAFMTNTTRRTIRPIRRCCSCISTGSITTRA